MAGYDPGNTPLARPLTPEQASEILDKIVTRHFDERLGPTSTAPLPAQPIDIDPMAQAVDATERFLNAQLLECVGMVRDCCWLYRNTVLDPGPRGEFVLQAAKIMDASVQMANCIRLLRGGEEQVRTTRHVMVVEKVEASAGGRGRSLRKTNNPMPRKKLSAGPRRSKGGQPGNVNARKTGMHSAEMRAFRGRVRDCLRRSRHLIALAECLAARREAAMSVPALRVTDFQSSRDWRNRRLQP